MKKVLSYLLIIPIIFSLVTILNPLDVSAQGNEVTLLFQHESYVDNNVITTIQLNSAGKTINSIVADFVYPSDILEVTNVIVLAPHLQSLFRVDYDTLGVVRLDYEGAVPVEDGAVAEIHFLVKGSGEAELRFTEDVKAGEAFPLLGQTVDYLERVEPGKYTVDEDFDVLPQTGTTEDIATATGIIVLILLLMILIFAFSSFTMWGGVYLSLGRWEGRLSVGAEKTVEKKDSGKKKISKKNGKSKKSMKRNK